MHGKTPVIQKEFNERYQRLIFEPFKETIDDYVKIDHSNRNLTQVFKTMMPDLLQTLVLKQEQLPEKIGDLKFQAVFDRITRTLNNHNIKKLSPVVALLIQFAVELTYNSDTNRSETLANMAIANFSMFLPKEEVAVLKKKEVPKTEPLKTEEVKTEEVKTEEDEKESEVEGSSTLSSLRKKIE